MNELNIPMMTSSKTAQTATRDRKILAIAIIDAFDGVKSTAIHCGLAVSTVSDWKAKGIPRSWAKYFETIRPDLFINTEQNK